MSNHGIPSETVPLGPGLFGVYLTRYFGSTFNARMRFSGFYEITPLLVLTSLHVNQ